MNAKQLVEFAADLRLDVPGAKLALLVAVEGFESAEITRLRAEVEALKLQGAAAELVHRETATTVLVQMAEVEALRADAATDRKLVQAAEKFIHPVLQELQFERGHGSLAVHNLRLVLIEAMKANAKHAEIDAARAAQGE